MNGREPYDGPPRKIRLKEEKETLLITLYVKALDSRSRRSVLHDTRADEILKSIDYDFSKHEWGANDIVVVRAKQYDEWIRAFLGQHADTIVLNLGCGLDTRVTRIDPPATVAWFDVDYPEVIDVRKQFFTDKIGYRMIASSVTDPAWLSAIPRDLPTLIIAEGLLEYLEPNEVSALLNRLLDNFSPGQIMFDVMSSFAVASGRKKLQATTGAVHKWAIDDPAEVDHLNARWTRTTAMSVFGSPYLRRLPIGKRLLYRGLALFPKFKKMMLLMRYDFM